MDKSVWCVFAAFIILTLAQIAWGVYRSWLEYRRELDFFAMIDGAAAKLRIVLSITREEARCFCIILHTYAEDSTLPYTTRELFLNAFENVMDYAVINGRLPSPDEKWLLEVVNTRRHPLQHPDCRCEVKPMEKNA